MADFVFDDLIDKIKNGAAKASKSAGDFAKSAASKIDSKTQEAKLKISVKELEDKLNGYYSTIGKSVYNAEKNCGTIEDFSELFGRIDALNEEIESLKGRIARSRDENVCSLCGAFVGKDDLYCPKCGTNLQDDE